MRLEFKGYIEIGDGYRCSSDGNKLNGSIHINKEDVIDLIAEENWKSGVKVYCNDELVAEGCCTSELGWGYSSWTPMDSDQCNINDFDLVGFLTNKEGQNIKLVITDEEV